MRGTHWYGSFLLKIFGQGTREADEAPRENRTQLDGLRASRPAHGDAKYTGLSIHTSGWFGDNTCQGSMPSYHLQKTCSGSKGTRGQEVATWRD
ncbi:hypothetical protein VFPBJ_05839 [Purpureocillium lilacinum]|uniref:Uncharacterized protein n=1 Tax=Purpureocillium lilacinum TaxID=33203 RepID=A0A179GQU6_PURLI|nr:hypothetical protein VFPBJ_05839 [Purpureocillium lilacinum]